MKFKIIGSIVILVIIVIALAVSHSGSNQAASDNADPDAVSQQQQ